MFTHPQSGFTRDGFRFFVEYDICRQGVALYVARRNPHNLVEHTQLANLQWEDHDDGSIFAAPTLVCDPESMQHLFNALWERGFRPSSPLRQDAIIEAKDAHIEDLRTIIFSQLKVKK